MSDENQNMDVLTENDINIVIEEIAEEPVVEEAVSEPVPVVEEVVAEPVAEEVVPEPVVEEVVAEPLVEEAAAEPLVEEAAAEPVAEEVAPEPVVEEAAAEPVAEEVVSEPEPVVEEVVPEPVVEEVVPEPVVEEVVPEPVVEEVVPEPVVEEAAPEPVVEEVVPEPVVEEVVPEPVVEEVAAEPEPVVEEVVPEPVVEEVVPEPIVEEVVAEPEPVVEEVAAEPVVEEVVAEPEPVAEVEYSAVEEGRQYSQENDSETLQSTEAVNQDVENHSESEPAENITMSTIEEPSTIVEESEGYVETTYSDNSIQEQRTPEIIPKMIFIVPYRDRKQQYEFFSNHMKMILADINPTDYKILYIHQLDSRTFNRGAMKNIGFITVKNMYPENYRDITLVFNDIDTMPYTKGFLNYDTTHGIVKHFYGYTFVLGGIVSIKAADFERVNGFPNFWAWGYEDNLLNQRVNEAGITIDRSQFYPMADINILQLSDGITRNVNKTEFDIYKSKTREGINTIYNLEYTVDEITGFVNVSNFQTDREENISTAYTYDLRYGNTPFAIKPHTIAVTPNQHVMTLNAVPRRRGGRMGLIM